MKKIYLIFTIFLLTVLLVSCSEEYEPVESTAEEKTVVMTLSYEGSTYEIKYELYRALFLNLKRDVDGGDNTVWSGDKKDEYIEKIDALIIERVSEIYSVFHIANKIGIDIYSDEFDEIVKDYIKASVEGGSINSTQIDGFGGDYDKYLESLREMNLNYSVQDLLLRYSIASEKIQLHYAGNLDTEEHIENTVTGAINYTEEDIREFYDSNDCVRVIRGFFSSEIYTKEKAEQFRDEIAKLNSEREVAIYIINRTTAGASDIINGELIATHNLERRYYKELVDGVFMLTAFETGPVYEISTGYEDGYIVIYRTIKSEEYYESCYDEIVRVYVDNEIGKIIDSTSDSLFNGAAKKDYLNSLDRSEISMD